MNNKLPFCAILTESELLDYPQELSQAIFILRANGYLVNGTIDTPETQFLKPDEVIVNSPNHITIYG